jgi:hypothetical protein
MDHKIDALEQWMDQKIDALEQRMDQKIDTLEQRMEQKIDGLEQGVDFKLNSLEHRINESLFDQETKLLTAFHDWAPRVEARVDSHSAVLRAMDARSNSCASASKSSKARIEPSPLLRP